MPQPATEINLLAKRYFSDLAAHGRPDNNENLSAWLWFRCPATLREHVRLAIVLIREAAQ